MANLSVLKSFPFYRYQLRRLLATLRIEYIWNKIASPASICNKFSRILKVDTWSICSVPSGVAPASRTLHNRELAWENMFSMNSESGPGSNDTPEIFPLSSCYPQNQNKQRYNDCTFLEPTLWDKKETRFHCSAENFLNSNSYASYTVSFSNNTLTSASWILT